MQASHAQPRTEPLLIPNGVVSSYCFGWLHPDQDREDRRVNLEHPRAFHPDLHPYSLHYRQFVIRVMRRVVAGDWGQAQRSFRTESEQGTLERRLLQLVSAPIRRAVTGAAIVMFLSTGHAGSVKRNRAPFSVFRFDSKSAHHAVPRSSLKWIGLFESPKGRSHGGA